MELKEKLFGDTKEEIQEQKKVQPQKDGKSEILSLVTTALEVNEEVKSIMNKIQIETYFGTLSLYEINQLVKAKILEYINLGIASKTQKEMLKQNQQTTRDEVLSMLLEMARLEVQYGLRPFLHVIPVAGQPYVKSDGYLWYARPYLKELRFEVKRDEKEIAVKCIATDKNGLTIESEVIVPAQPRNQMDNPIERAKTKAIRSALRRLLPIGSDEIFDEYTNQPVLHVEQLPAEKIATKIDELEL